MIKSMTGFGLVSKETAKAKITVEIKSLNSKYFEFFLKVHRIYSEKELIIRSECNRLIERGKVSMVITVDYFEGFSSQVANIDSVLFNAYYNQLQNLSLSIEEQTNNIFELALNMPEVIRQQDHSINNEEWNEILETIKQSISELDKFRTREGLVLERDIIIRVNNILNLLKKVNAEDPNRLQIARDRINKYFEDNLGADKVDKNRLEQELIFYIEKFDITEEKIRLNSHCEYFLNTIKEGSAGGKKLGFICQEMGREINTLGAKANDVIIQRLVVEMKDELEKIKEQLLNVL